MIQNTPPQTTVLYNAKFTYASTDKMSHNPTTCHLLLLKQDTGHHIVICTELKDNHGKSIENSSEAMATSIVQRFALQPETTLFIEHFSDTLSYGASVASEPDRYSAVSYTWTQTLQQARLTEIDSKPYCNATKPQWSYRSVEDVLKLVAIPLVNAEQLSELTESDYEFVGILAGDERKAVRNKELIMPMQLPQRISSTPDAIIAIPGSYSRIPFLWGVARSVGADVVKVALQSGDNRARFYGLPVAIKSHI